MSLERTITKECSGSFETMLLAMIMDPNAYYAMQLKEAFKGLTTDKTALARILGGNDKPAVDEIAECYRTNYGETLMAALKKETCLLYTSPSPRDLSTPRMPSSA